MVVGGGSRGAGSRTLGWQRLAEAVGLVSVYTSVSWDWDSLWYHREKLFWNYIGRSSRAVAVAVVRADCIGRGMKWDLRKQENWMGFLGLAG